MHFGIDCGHGGSDPGAINKRRNLKEADLTRIVGKLVRLKLQDLGHDVLDCSPDSIGDSLWARCNIANRNKVDYYVSIHFNAFNRKAYGSEILYTSQNGLALAQNVLPHILALGFRNRGCKYRDNLYVLNRTRMPAIIIECCFIDSERDMNLYDPNKMANAIAGGLHDF